MNTLWLLEHPDNSNIGSTNGINLGRDYLFGWPMTMMDGMFGKAFRKQPYFCYLVFVFQWLVFNQSLVLKVKHIYSLSFSLFISGVQGPKWAQHRDDSDRVQNERWILLGTEQFQGRCIGNDWLCQSNVVGHTLCVGLICFVWKFLSCFLTLYAHLNTACLYIH